MAYEIAQAIINMGGPIPPDPARDAIKTKLEDYCRQARANLGPKPTNMTQAEYGNQLHEIFDALVWADGDTRLWGETSYNNQVYRHRRNPATDPPWSVLDGKRPDAVWVDANNNPKALFDLKSGTHGIRSRWKREIRPHLPPGSRNIPIIRISC